jgi:hypothetical protein
LGLFVSATMPYRTSPDPLRSHHLPIKANRPRIPRFSATH